MTASLHAFIGSIVDGVKPVEYHHVPFVFREGFAPVPLDVPKGQRKVLSREVPALGRLGRGAGRRTDAGCSGDGQVRRCRARRLAHGFRGHLHLESVQIELALG